MKQRTITALGIIAILVLVLFSRMATTFVFDAFVLLLCGMGIYEASKIQSKIGNYNSKIFAGVYVALSYALYLISLYNKVSIQIVVLLQLLLVIFMLLLQFSIMFFMKKTTKNEIETRKLKLSVTDFSFYKSMHTMFVYLYPAFLLMFFVLINNLHLFESYFLVEKEYLQAIATFGIIITFVIPAFADTFAYIFGSMIGGKKLCPKISPKKTISGAIFGLIFGIIGAVLCYYIFTCFELTNIAFNALNFKFWHFIILGFIASIAAQCGDIFESYLKRKAEVKDSGTILPGHGGILDRIDSHMFVAPMVFIFLIILI